MFPNTAPMIAGPSAPDNRVMQRLPGAYQGSVAPGLLPPPQQAAPSNYQLPGGTYYGPGTLPAGTGPGWARFMANARPSVNIEDHRK